MIVELFTSDLRLVDTVELLPYKIKPEVILYGERVFVLRGGGDCSGYYEALVAVPLVTGVQKQ